MTFSRLSSFAMCKNKHSKEMKRKPRQHCCSRFWVLTNRRLFLLISRDSGSIERGEFSWNDSEEIRYDDYFVSLSFVRILMWTIKLVLKPFSNYSWSFLLCRHLTKASSIKRAPRKSNFSIVVWWFHWGELSVYFTSSWPRITLIEST